MSKLPLLKEFTPSGFFVLRSPLLPFDMMLEWGEGLRSVPLLADPVQLERAHADDRIRLRARLAEVVERPEVREAIFLASPDLNESLERWRRDPEGRRGQRIERALIRYFSRMAGRPTPFGLFAGWSVGTLGSETHLEVEGRSRYRRHTRLDMDYLYALAAAVERDPALRAQITYRTNPSLYRAAGRIRYVESRQKEMHHLHHLVAVESADYIEAALRVAEGGGVPSDLAAKLAEADPSFSRDEAEAFIDDLIENQLLLSDFSPTLTGPQPTPILAAQLEGYAGGAPLAERLRQAHAALAAVDAGGLGNSPELYHAVADTLRELPVVVNPSRLFNVDMLKPALRAVLGRAPLEEVARGVEILRRLRTPFTPDPLAGFRRAFLERYGEGREVPLVEALDDDVGIGFRLPGTADATPLPQDGEVAGQDTEESPRAAKCREAHLLRLYAEALARGEREVSLSPHDIEELEGEMSPPPLQDAFEVMATVAAASEAELERGSFRVFISTVSGPSGVRLLGRFCHADPDLERLVKEHLRAEESLLPEAIFAEVVHLPSGRTGNVLLRPLLREYEIPYVGRSGAAEDRQIPVSDLLVTVRGGRITLRSRRLQREVIPRLTAAHNFKVRGLNLYQFLGVLQRQEGLREMHWSWGHLSDAPFLPRVTAGRLVLSKARWLIGRKELLGLGAGRGAEQFRAVQDWRVAHRLPRFVALSEADNELIIDLDNALSVETFVELVKGREEATLVEMFPAPDELCARGPEGRFVHEMIVPFLRVGAATRRAQRVPPPPLTKVTRTFPPGTDWLYVKLYTGISTADYVLRDMIRPLVEQFADRVGGDRPWFFIRYADPDAHLRLRFHGKAETLHADLLPAISAAAIPLLADGRLWRVQVDTYEREVERYGGAEGVVLAEHLFHADSDAVLSIVEAFSGNEGAASRWLLALRGVDMLLRDFDLDVAGKRVLLSEMRESYGGKIVSGVNFRRQSGERYRRERSEIDMILDPTQDESSALSAGLSALRHRSARLKPVVAGMAALKLRGGQSLPLCEIIPSFLHMHVNRTLRLGQRWQELMLYDFLARFYESQTARGR
jgi:thiopeptide-type bacteriocin biosynthesis protein